MSTRSDPATRLWRLFNLGLLGLGVLLLAGFFGMMALNGQKFPPSAPCLPPAFHLSAPTAHPGDTLTVEAPDAECHPHYGANAQAEVQLMDRTSTSVVRLLVPMSDDGGFRTTLNVPGNVPPGDYTVTATPYGIDTCFDSARRAGSTPDRQNSGAAAFAAHADAGPPLASCAAPQRPLAVVAR
ncbi:hypothetical protein QFZ52_002661 [Arthrobacter woluwensis]|uniref:hypothetical protein n=1 Tax=Arthrobacter woluwensis TaxID=156980 RepID=UPI0027831E46|nr:hypothetical protein [Arthrobacter woluwensis]MDQ0710009.1 hypothetical protein [Arthrobacter woluwensis]